jgi:hypothetical protein
MDQLDAPTEPAGEDAFDQMMQRKLARLQNSFMVLEPTAEQVAKVKSDVIASMERARQMEASRKTDKRVGLPDTRAELIERRSGDRRRGGRKDESK